MEQIILIIHVLVSIFLIVLILIQHGKGADAGASFGGGASQTVFGSQGKAPFLMKLTGGLAAVFFITCLVLGNIAANNAKQKTVLQIPAQSSHVIPVKQKATKVTAPKKANPLSSKIPVTQ